MSDESQKSRERFGRYLILDHLVDGGMAKICRARFLGEQADKIVAIKMVQPQYSQNESFKTMFMDEIKVTFGLLHPNIVQTYDYGMQHGQLYVAMEYCDGRNLKEYLDKLKKRGFIFPIEISVYIVSQACQGLFYAHTLTDKLTGKAANIVHRDISPHNIMLTYDGAIKVIDFGIAKAESNSEATQAGTIKGKLSYLAPEYLDGQELDPRYDQFAVGITLWEMLCSRKLFKAPNDLAVLKKIQECKVPPPSSINPMVPKELDQIVLRSLSKDRSKRFADLNEMNKELTRFLYSYKADFNATDLAYFAKELFKEEIKTDREKLFEFGKIDLKPFLEDLKREQNGGGPQVVVQSSGESEELKPENRVLDFGFEEKEEVVPKLKALRAQTKTATKTAAVQETTKRRDEEDDNLQIEVKPRTTTTGTTTGASTAVKTGTRKIKTASGATKTRTRVKSGTRTVSRKKAVKQQPKTSPAAMVGLVAVLAAVAWFGKDTLMELAGFNTTPVAAVTTPVNEQPVGVVGKKPASAQASAKVTLIGVDKRRQRAFIDGKEVDINFIGQIEVPVDQEVTLRIQSRSKEHYVTKVLVSSGEPEKNLEVPETRPTAFGYLMNSRNCLAGQVEFELYGEERIEKLPLATGGIALPLDFSADGKYIPKSHSLTHRRPDGIAKRINFTLKHEDDTVDICEL
ncbi:MAG: hypothetical protein CME71_08445 [Halobacteriovorax sp.]|nr:hypothetical protein [Halobacteriovorax sp.]